MPKPHGGAPRGGGKGKGSSRVGEGFKAKVSTSKREEAEIKELDKRIVAEAPEPGSAEVTATEFSQLPLCRYTMTGLQRSKFRVMTQIQRVAILHGLKGRDVLGAAKTGSGKTLAFVVPLLETLFRSRWANTDGLGALVISPTRELALQIFEVVKSVGWAHYALSAGVVCGGKSFEEERDAIGRMSILVATPGRLLQHLEQSPDFDVSALRLLVLDEADRLLDMGFSDTLNSILSYLPGPPQRQTMLFSATQTKSVKDLSRLSLQSPEYVAVHETAASATPSRLAQTYVVVELQDKLNLLYSFVRSHLTTKTIVFVSSCKQARFLFESFRRLRPGVPLQLLHGKMKQQRRMLVYYDFVKKPACVLFATDVAARGLDFPSVDWVVQLDCPEDTAAYIHRVGRTARFKSKGHGLLVLLPSEEQAMLGQLAAAKVPLTQIHVNPSSAVSVTSKLAAEVAADPELKQLAQRAFGSYVRSVHLQPNRAIFSVAALPTSAFAESLGLATVPDVKVLRAAAAAGSSSGGAEDDAATAVLRSESHKLKNANKALMRLKESIAAAKARKRQEAATGAAGGAASTAAAAAAPAAAAAASRQYDSDASSSSGDSDAEGDSDDASSDDDDGDEEVNSGDDAEGNSNGKGRSAPPRSGGPLATASNSKGTERSSGFLLRRVAAAPASSSSSRPAAAAASVGAAGAASAAAEAEEDDGSAAALAGLTRAQQAKVHRVAAEAALLGQRDGAKRGADGLTPFQRVAAAKKEAAAAEARAPADAADLAAKAASHAERIAARLATTAGRDRQLERDRVKQKHRDQRRRAKGLDNEEEEEDEGAFAAPRIGGGPDDDDDEGAGSAARAHGVGSVEAQGGGAEEEEEAGVPSLRAGSQMDKRERKRPAPSQAAEEGQDEEAVDDEEEERRAKRKRRSLTMTAAATAAR